MPPFSITRKGSGKEALDFCDPVTKEAQIVTKTLQIGSDNKSANECQNCRKVTATFILEVLLISDAIKQKSHPFMDGLSA